MPYKCEKLDLFINKTLVNQQSLEIMQTWIDDDDRVNLGVGLLQQYKHLNLGHIVAMLEDNTGLHVPYPMVRVGLYTGYNRIL